MKWFLYFCLLILILSSILFYKSYSALHQELNIHATEIGTTSPYFFTAKTEYLINSDHQKIAFYSFPVRHPNAVVILAHGYSNPGGKNQMLEHVDYLKQANYSVYLLDFRSFGESDGQKIYLGTKEWQDLETLYDYIYSLPENNNIKIGYLGFSMGAASAINSVAKTGKGDFIIASAPYASIDSMYQFRLNQNKFPYYIFTKLAVIAELGTDSQKISPENLISKINVPIIIFSAQNDIHVDNHDAQQLYDLLITNLTKDYWQADNSDHDIFASHPDDFQQHVLDFLAKHL